MSRTTTKSKMINFRLPFEQLKQLKRLAIHGDKSMTSVLVELIQLATESDGKKPE